MTGMMAVAVSPSVQLAAVISSGFYSIWFLFSGFLIPRPRMPVWWRWYSYLDPGELPLLGICSKGKYGQRVWPCVLYSLHCKWAANSASA